MARPASRTGFAMIQPQKALAQSPALRKLGEIGDAKDRNRSPDIGWQTDAYDLAREVGEAGYVMHLTANTLSMCSFVPRLTTEDGLDDDDTDDRPFRVMEALLGPTGGQKEIKRRIALHAAIAGEWYLLGSGTSKNSGLLWEVLSVRELQIGHDGQAVRRRDGFLREELTAKDSSYLARGWISDAEFSDRADSQMRRALAACREVKTHSQVIDATSKSRVAAGILFIPEEMSFGTEDEDLNDEALMDALTSEVLNHLAAPIEDQTSQASYVPLVMRGPAEHGTAIRLIELGKSFDEMSVELREKALQRLLRMMDVPPELVSGKGAMSHWGSYNVDREFLMVHVAPLGETIADFLAAAYLRPMLEAFEGMSADEASKWILDFDMSAVTTRSDEEASARALGDRGLLSEVTQVKAHGFEPGDMPDDEERLGRSAWELVKTNIALAPVLLPYVPGWEDVDMKALADALAAAGPAPAGPAAAEPAPDSNPPPNDDVIDAESGNEEPAPEPPTRTGTESLVIRLATAADSALDRALEKAGARLITHGQKDMTIRDRLGSVDKIHAFQLVGPTEITRLGLSTDALFDGCWDRLALKARAWMRDWSVVRGVPEAQADDAAMVATAVLCERLTSHMLSNLHGQIPVGSNGMRVPNELVEDAVRLVLGPMVQ